MATAPLSEHIVTSYEDELINLNKAISEMGGMVEQAITDAATALLRLDHEGAREVRAYDQRIDDMKDRITDMAILMIARRQPMAADLRMVVTSIQVANDLERTGDMAKQLAKRTLQIESLTLAPKFYNGVKHMTELVARQLKAALDAYASRDAIFDDLAVAYQKAIKAFYDAGCRYLQFDDTAWAYLCSQEELKKARDRGLDVDHLQERHLSVDETQRQQL